MCAFFLWSFHSLLLVFLSLPLFLSVLFLILSSGSVRILGRMPTVQPQREKTISSWEFAEKLFLIRMWNEYAESFHRNTTQILLSDGAVILRRRYDTLVIKPASSRVEKKLTQSTHKAAWVSRVFETSREARWIYLYAVSRKIYIQYFYSLMLPAAAVKEIYNRVSIYLWRVKKSVFSFRWKIVRVWRASTSGKRFLAYFSIEKLKLFTIISQCSSRDTSFSFSNVENACEVSKYFFAVVSSNLSFYTSPAFHEKSQRRFIAKEWNVLRKNLLLQVILRCYKKWVAVLWIW